MDDPHHPLGAPGIILPLLEFLTLGEIFRLHRALAHANALPKDTIHVVAQRMQLKIVRPSFTLNTLSRRMYAGRCVECGVRCACRPVVCAGCTRSETSFRSMVTRAEIRSMRRERGLPRRRSIALVQLCINGHVKRGRLGAFYYWRKDVERILECEVFAAVHAHSGARQTCGP